MKFRQLLKKEMYESLPWLSLGAIITLLIGFLIYKVNYIHGYRNYRVYEPASAIEWYNMFYGSSLEISGVWLFLTAVGLGLALGVRQFWLPSFKHLWAFELHRSVSRHTVLSAKLFTAAAAFALSLGGSWVFLYIIYMYNPSIDYLLPTARNLYEGFLLIGFGFIAYLATVLVGLNTARWYTTRGFPFGLAIIIIYGASQYLLWVSLIVLIIGGAILLLQIFDTFLKREF